jgi:hypothetical protein
MGWRGQENQEQPNDVSPWLPRCADPPPRILHPNSDPRRFLPCGIPSNNPAIARSPVRTRTVAGAPAVLSKTGDRPARELHHEAEIKPSSGVCLCSEPRTLPFGILNSDPRWGPIRGLPATSSLPEVIAIQGVARPAQVPFPAAAIGLAIALGSQIRAGITGD